VARAAPLEPGRRHALEHQADESPTAAAFTGDGKTLFAVHRERGSRWNLADGTRTALSGEVVDSGSRQILGVTPDGKTVAVGGKKNDLVLLDGETFKEQKRLPGHKEYIFSVTLAPDGKTLATVAIDDPNVRLWDLVKGEPAGTILCDRGRLTRVAFSPSGRYLVGGGSDFSLREPFHGRNQDHTEARNGPRDDRAPTRRQAARGFDRAGGIRCGIWNRRSRRSSSMSKCRTAG
jgi:hypothetical protein